jgi:hypothetical protein
MTLDRLESQRTALTRYRRGLIHPFAAALHAGDEMAQDELRLELHRLTVCVRVLDNWLIELRGQAAVEEAERILALDILGE